MPIGYRTRIGPFLKFHWPAFVLAVIVGLMTAFPPAIAISRIGSSYEGIAPVVIDDQMYYLARAHEAFDGHPTLGSPYLAEYKNLPSGQSWIPDMVLALLIQPIGIQYEPIVYGFVFSLLIILVSYAIMYFLSRDRFFSLALAFFADPGINFQTFLRTPHPQLLLLLFAALFALLVAVERKNKWWGIAGMLLGAMLFYIYPFYWTYWIVMVGLAIPACFMLARESNAHRKLVMILVGAIVLGIPYFIENYHTAKISNYNEALQRIGFIQTHFPSGLYIACIVIAVFILWLWAWFGRRIVHRPAYILIAVAALAGLVVTNQAVITGINFFFTVHYTTFVQFMCIFVVGALLPPIFRHYTPPNCHSIGKWMIASALILFALHSAIPHMEQLATPTAFDINVQRYGPVLRWLDANTQTDDVVYADKTFSLYVPAYTRDNVFFSSYAQQMLISNQAVQDRYIRWHYFDSLTRQSIIANEADVFGAHYLGRWQHITEINKARTLVGLTPLAVARYPEDTIGKLINEEHVLQEASFYSAIQGYTVQYFVWDSVQEPLWGVNTVPGLHKLYEANGIMVYAILQNT